MNKKQIIESRVNFGLKNENFYEPVIRKFIKEKFPKYSKFNKSPNVYDKYDWIGDNILIELKTRTCYKNKYPTTIIGYDKIQFGLNFLNNIDNMVLLFFGFKDGLYYYELKKSQIDINCVYKSGCVKVNSIKDYLHINNIELIKISNLSYIN